MELEMARPTLFSGEEKERRRSLLRQGGEREEKGKQ